MILMSLMKNKLNIIMESFLKKANIFVRKVFEIKKYRPFITKTEEMGWCFSGTIFSILCNTLILFINYLYHGLSPRKHRQVK